MGIEVEMRNAPPCDLCGDGTPAAYDSKTRQGPWAWLCEPHWRINGVGRLGTGYGQKLNVRGSTTKGDA